jgi:exopolyphosphatase/guanosine-5'-triphosphate,3'-diphosphate pyrophosphatase
VKSSRRVALIEIGTNTTKLLIADTDPQGYRIRYAARQTTRIGRGLAGGGRIDPRAVTDNIAAVESFMRTVRERRCHTLFAYSTFALRRASNSSAVIRRLEKALGAPLRVLSGRVEARFAYLSAKRHVYLRRPHTVLVDIGGGSTELVVARKGSVIFARSIPLGALHLTERFIHTDPIDEGEFEALADHVDRTVASALAAAGVDRILPRDTDLVGSGGAIGALSWVIAGSFSSGRGRPPASRLPREVRLGEAAAFLDRCLVLPLGDRRRIRGLDPNRADIVCAGLAVVVSIMRHMGKRVLLANPGGVREGALIHLIQNGLRW